MRPVALIGSTARRSMILLRRPLQCRRDLARCNDFLDGSDEPCWLQTPHFPRLSFNFARARMMQSGKDIRTLPPTEMPRVVARFERSSTCGSGARRRRLAMLRFGSTWKCVHLAGVRPRGDLAPLRSPQSLCAEPEPRTCWSPKGSPESCFALVLSCRQVPAIGQTASTRWQRTPRSTLPQKPLRSSRNKVRQKTYLRFSLRVFKVAV